MKQGGQDPFSPELAGRVDREKVIETYRAWPRLAEQGMEVRPDVGLRRYKRVYILGMGGSAAAGDILSSWFFYEHQVDAQVCKGMIGATDLRGSLAIAISASGETEETLSMLKTAADGNATVVSISYGGALAEESEKRGIPHIQMPKVVAPRYMLPFMVFSSVAVADRALGLDSSTEAREAVDGMKRLAAKIDVGVPLGRNPSKQVALRLLQGYPAVYATKSTRGVGIRFKNCVNENAKSHATYDEMPELFHNEVQAWEDRAARFVPVMLRDSTESERDARLAGRFASILGSLGRNPVVVRGAGAALLTRLMTMVYELDLATYYLAVARGNDPFPTRLINRLKES